MRNRIMEVKQATTLVLASSAVALALIGGADSAVERRLNIADQELFFAPVPKAVCGPGDKPETALQGQVTAAMRAAGFQGFSCNLKLIGQVRGEGANWQTDEWREGRGKTRKVCAYHGTASPLANTLPRVNYGVRVIDVTNPAAPVNTAYLNSISMLDPWESLKTNKRRQLLAAVNAQDGGTNGGPQIDIYDVSGDCRFPQMLSSTAMVDPNNPIPILGHEGNWAPDGMTYYGGDLRYTPAGSTSVGRYYAIDTTNTTQPRFITAWQTGVPNGRIHGLSVSDDGNRGYFVSIGALGGSLADLFDPNVPANNGLLIYDLSDIQARRTDPQVKLVGSVFWKDGSVAQHTINARINGKPYIVFVDEGGSGGISSAAQEAAACAAGLSPFPMARIIDISDETKPSVVSKVMLEVHDPANCDKVLPDLTGLLTFTYGSHYCSVDNIHRTTTLACGYFNSGIRVFDIRDPIRPREIAYYNPAGTTTPSAGANHIRTGGWVAGGPDWCNAQVHLDAEQGTLWTTCQDNGLLSLQFTHNAWPFAETRTPPGMQN